MHVVCPAGIVQERANPTGFVGSWALAGKPRVRVGTRIAKAAAAKLLRSFMGGVVGGVVEIELCLEAGKGGRPLLEHGDGLAQLVALRPVLGVVDDEIFAAGEGERIIERLWLGARLKVRHHHDLDIAGEIEAARHGDRLDVDRFQD